jgi:hypothetical protein
MYLLPARSHAAATPVRTLLLLLSPRAASVAPANSALPATAVRMPLRMHVGRCARFASRTHKGTTYVWAHLLRVMQHLQHKIFAKTYVRNNKTFINIRLQHMKHLGKTLATYI